MQQDWHETPRQWSNEEIYNLITMDGRNAHPADVTVSVCNPKSKPDLQDCGGEYHESNEEFLERTGHLLPHEPTLVPPPPPPPRGPRHVSPV